MYSYNVHIFYVCVLYIVLYVFMWVRIQIFLSAIVLHRVHWHWQLLCGVSPFFHYKMRAIQLSLYLHTTFSGILQQVHFLTAFFSVLLPWLGSILCRSVTLFLRTDNTRTLRRTFGKATFYGYISKTGTTKYFLCDVLNVGFFLYIASLTLLPRLTRAAGIFCH